MGKPAWYILNHYMWFAYPMESLLIRSLTFIVAPDSLYGNQRNIFTVH
jgi:hypothetical protein